MSVIEHVSFRLVSGSELLVVVPYCIARCSANIKVLPATGGSEPRVDILGAPVIADVSYNLTPGVVFTVFAWSNANIRIEGPKQLLRNCFRSTTPPLSRCVVEYHCLVHSSRLIADKQSLFGPMTVICGKNDIEKHVVARTLSSYATRTGWSPQLVDLDCGLSQLLGTPATVSSSVIECPMTIDEETNTGPLSLAFFVGSTEPQTKGALGEWNMFAPYVHYCHLLLSCVSERIARHKGGAGGSSGAIIVLPELKGSSGVHFILDIIRHFNISHVLCIGDDFVFCSLQERIPGLREHMASRVGTDIRIDKLSQSPHFPSPDTRPERFSSSMERYFFGGGSVDLQPSEISRRYGNIDILRLKDANGQVVVSPVEQDALEGIVGCIGSLFDSVTVRKEGVLSLAPFALARVQGIDANGVILLVSTHSSIPENLTMMAMNSLCETIRLSGLREAVCFELAALLSGFESNGSSTKVIYASPNILSILEAITASEELIFDELGVLGIFRLGHANENVTADHGIFLVNADVDLLQMLSMSVLAFAAKNPSSSLRVLFVPRKTVMINHILEHSFHSLVSIPRLHLTEFDLDAFPLDEDVLSMQLPCSFKQLTCDGDLSILHLCSRMLLKFQTSHVGSIPLVRGRGPYAAKVVRILKRMRTEFGNDQPLGVVPKVDSLFILDRTVDLLTPLLTQLTYEGIVDEFFSINSGLVTLPFDVGEGPGMCAGQRISLTHNDKVFKEIRDRNFTHVGPVLHNKSVWIKQKYEKRKELQQLKELKDFMKGLPEMQETHRLIGVHTAIATEIGKRTQSIDFRRRIVVEQYIVQRVNEGEVLEYIEELVNDSAPITDTLRLLAMFSVVNGGLKDKTYDHFKQILMLSYGIPLVLTALACLERCGLITRHDPKRSNYPLLLKQFHLWNPELQNQQVNNIACPYGGYVPLSVRLLESMITRPELWDTPGSLAEPGPEEKAEIRYDGETPEGPPVTMFLLVGGITYAEISAVRLLQSKLSDAGEPRHIIVATTGVVNGASVISSALPGGYDM